MVKIRRTDGKRTFIGYEKTDDDTFIQRYKMSSYTPGVSARKIGNKECKANNLQPTDIFIREAGIHNKMRRYYCTVRTDLIVEPTASINIKRSITRNITAEELTEANQRFANMSINPTTAKSFTKKEAKTMNATLKDGLIILNKGKHLIYNGTVCRAKYIGIVTIDKKNYFANGVD